MDTPKIQLFLSLLSHNKLATVDNLNRKGLSKRAQHCFCSKNESIVHLFFECVVAKVIWGYVGVYLGYDLGASYLTVASKWLQKEKFYSVNIVSTIVLRGIWLIRNDFIFNKQVWSDIKLILRRMLRLTVEQKIIFKESRREEMERWSSFLEKVNHEPLRITSAKISLRNAMEGHLGPKLMVNT
jgi:hypothetical protein